MSRRETAAFKALETMIDVEVTSRLQSMREAGVDVEERWKFLLTIAKEVGDARDTSVLRGILSRVRQSKE